ncbi:MAG: methionyl-tRNA formyltransferase [Lentisphaeria bacterium]
MKDSAAVKVYFLGSGKLGIPVIDALLDDPRIEIMGVGSQPDQPVGRKLVITPTVFASHVLSKGLHVDRINSVNDECFYTKLTTLNVELLIVVAFGQLLKEKLLTLPQFGCLNVHASILPHFRGACPISSVILNNDDRTGVTFMRMDKGLDTGPIYQTLTTPVKTDENSGQLEARLARLAARKISDIVWQIARENLEARPQPYTDEPAVHKIRKKAGAVNWNYSASHIANMVRAYTPWPKVYATFPGKKGKLRRIQITEAHVIDETLPDTLPGQVLQPLRNGIAIACSLGILKIIKLIPEGKSEMNADDYLRGHALPMGTILSSAQS